VVFLITCRDLSEKTLLLAVDDWYLQGYSFGKFEPFSIASTLLILTHIRQTTSSSANQTDWQMFFFSFLQFEGNVSMKKHGFTLVELLVVIAIIGVLVALLSARGSGRA
jgi:prepilin-type N-terminal cleavage/methylation domain-containing protein